MPLQELPIDDLSPSRLWGALDAETRALAARAMYGERETRREADAAVASALRFRPAAVSKLPVEQRVNYLLRAVHPDDGLAGSLLLALHLTYRRPLLAAFLDRLGIPHDDGLIDPDHDVEQIDPQTLTAAVEQLYTSFPAADVELYLTSLVAMDPDAWSGLLPALRERNA